MAASCVLCLIMRIESAEEETLRVSAGTQQGQSSVGARAKFTGERPTCCVLLVQRLPAEVKGSICFPRASSNMDILGTSLLVEAAREKRRAETVSWVEEQRLEEESSGTLPYYSLTTEKLRVHSVLYVSG